jgi:mycofactocin precursor
MSLLQFKQTDKHEEREMAIADPSDDTQTVPAATDDESQQPAPVVSSDEELVESELLVEDVSIDGMCGVY